MQPFCPPPSQSHGASKASAIRDFTALYQDKTGNAWEDRGNFVKHPNKFYPLEIDYGQEREVGVARLGEGVGSRSKLAPAVQDLVRLLFDVESMKRAMLEFEVWHHRCYGNQHCMPTIYLNAMHVHVSDIYI